jgi:hypothetical protein
MRNDEFGGYRSNHGVLQSSDEAGGVAGIIDRRPTRDRPLVQHKLRQIDHRMAAMMSSPTTSGEVSELDLHRITHPLRLAKGSHRPGSGRGCAMNVISYINGDAQITDFPSCSARPLAAFVQWCNDLLAGPDGYLSSANGLLVLELGWQTMGTADVCRGVVHAWVADMLTSPTWGVAKYAKSIAAAEAIYGLAELHRMVASGDAPRIAMWYAADRAGRAAARALSPTLSTEGRYAVRAAYQSTAIAGTDHSARLDAVTGNVLRAHTLGIGSTAGALVVQLTRNAIGSWRRLARLDACMNHVTC